MVTLELKIHNLELERLGHRASKRDPVHMTASTKNFIGIETLLKSFRKFRELRIYDYVLTTRSQIPNFEFQRHTNSVHDSLPTAPSEPN